MLHYAVALVPDPEAGDLRVVCRDLPEVVTGGADEADALAQAADAIEVVVAYRIDKGLDLPDPSPAADGERPVPLPAPLAAKAAVYRAWRRSGLSKSALALRMGVAEGEVRRILDPGHATRLDRLDEAARALGSRLVIDLADAA